MQVTVLLFLAFMALMIVLHFAVWEWADVSIIRCKARVAEAEIMASHPLRIGDLIGAN